MKKNRLPLGGGTIDIKHCLACGKKIKDILKYPINRETKGCYMCGEL